MKKDRTDMTKMEFLLTLNDNIIVQRYFNLKGYNNKALNSAELYDVVKDIENEIHKDLKMKSIVYLLDNKFQIYEDANIIETSMTDDDEHFNIYIKKDDQILHHRAWNGKVYPPKIRYTVDVRPHLKSILRELTEVFSNDKLTHEYMEYTLV